MSIYKLQCGQHLWFCTVPSQKKNTPQKRKSCTSEDLAAKRTSMSTPIPFPGNAGTMLLDGVVTGSHKRKQAFSWN